MFTVRRMLAGGLRRHYASKSPAMTEKVSQDVEMQYLYFNGKHESCASIISLGCYGLSSVDPSLATSMIHKSIDHGVTFFDTSDYVHPAVGRGRNERLVSSAVRSYDGNADLSNVMIGSTVGRTYAPDTGKIVYDCSPDHIFKSCEESLKALDAECIDVYQLAGRDPRTPLTESVRAMKRLQDMGLIRYIGLSDVVESDIRRASTIAKISTVQMSLNCSNATSQVDVMRYCRENNIVFMAHTPLGGADGCTDLLASPAVANYASMLFRKKNVPKPPTHAQVALYMLMTIGENIVMLPGPVNMQQLEEVLSCDEVVLGEYLQTKASAFQAKVMDGEGSDDGSMSNSQIKAILQHLQNCPPERMQEEMSKIPPHQLNEIAKGIGIDPSKFSHAMYEPPSKK